MAALATEQKNGIRSVFNSLLDMAIGEASEVADRFTSDDQVIKAVASYNLFSAVRSQFYEANGYYYHYIDGFYFEEDGRLYVIAVEDETAKMWKAYITIANGEAEFGEWSEVVVEHNEKAVAFGSEIKAVGNGKVQGYLVRFSSESDTDLEGDFFDADTDFGFEKSAEFDTLYHHGLDATIKSRAIGTLKATIDDIGIWVEAQLNMRDEYEQAIYAMAEQKKLGWSSGANPSSVKRVAVGSAKRIATWHIIEGSLTPTPAESKLIASTKTLTVSMSLADHIKDSTMNDETGVSITPAVDETAVAQDATETAAETAETNETVSTDSEILGLLGDLTAMIQSQGEEIKALNKRLDSQESAKEKAAQKMADEASPAQRVAALRAQLRGESTEKSAVVDGRSAYAKDAPEEAGAEKATRKYPQR